MAPIFIVGSGRSGTSLVRALLNAHPCVHLGQESALFRWSQRWSSLSARDFQQAYPRTASGALFAPEPVQLAPDASHCELIAAWLEARAARHGKVRWGDKTPLHALHIPQIRACFPGAKIVAMTRHPVPTVASLAGMCWSSGSVVADALMTGQALEKISLDPSIYRLRLEDLIQDPEGRLRALMEFLEEEFHPSLLAHHEHADFSSDPALPWLLGAQRPLRPARASQVSLSPAQVALVERICPPERYGYAPWQRPIGASHLGTTVSEVTSALSFLARAGLTGPSPKPERLDPRAQLVWLWSLNPKVEVPAGLLESVLGC